MNAQAGVPPGALVNFNQPTLETMKQQGQIVTLEGGEVRPESGNEEDHAAPRGCRANQSNRRLNRYTNRPQRHIRIA